MVNSLVACRGAQRTLDAQACASTRRQVGRVGLQVSKRIKFALLTSWFWYMFALSNGFDMFWYCSDKSEGKRNCNQTADDTRRQSRFLCVCHESKTHTVSKGLFHTILTHIQKHGWILYTPRLLPHSAAEGFRAASFNSDPSFYSSVWWLKRVAFPVDPLKINHLHVECLLSKEAWRWNQCIGENLGTLPMFWRSFKWLTWDNGVPLCLTDFYKFMISVKTLRDSVCHQAINFSTAKHWSSSINSFTAQLDELHHAPWCPMKPHEAPCNDAMTRVCRFVSLSQQYMPWVAFADRTNFSAFCSSYPGLPCIEGLWPTRDWYEEGNEALHTWCETSNGFVVNTHFFQIVHIQHACRIVLFFLQLKWMASSLDQFDLTSSWKQSIAFVDGQLRPCFRSLEAGLHRICCFRLEGPHGDPPNFWHLNVLEYFGILF